MKLIEMKRKKQCLSGGNHWKSLFSLLLFAFRIAVGFKVNGEWTSNWYLALKKSFPEQTMCNLFELRYRNTCS